MEDFVAELNKLEMQISDINKRQKIDHITNLKK